MRPLLVRFATLQLRNSKLAEDAVQDALIRKAMRQMPPADDRGEDQP